MKNLLYISFFLLGVITNAQTALYNNGKIRIHENGQLGFHTDLINDSPFDSNLGLAGFYGSESLFVTGAVVPQFYDTEISLENNLFLEVGLDNANNTNFIVGNIFTARNQPNIQYTFLENAFYTGDGDIRKIDGYAGMTNKQDFLFPVGDATQLRPLELNSESTNLTAKCAYFFENASSPTSIIGDFNRDNLEFVLEFVSDVEFWRLEGNVPSTVTLSWNARSNMSTLTDETTNIVVVGWNKTGNRWQSLESTTVVGTLEEGFVTSETFNPSDYELLTLGVSKIQFKTLSNEELSLENYFLSPNGDGVNDSFFIPELSDSPNNVVRIYDRYGLKVFEKNNYINEFVGVSNVGNFVINRESGLPVGVYFYTIYMEDLDLYYQGFLYLAR